MGSSASSADKIPQPNPTNTNTNPSPSHAPTTPIQPNPYITHAPLDPAHAKYSLNFVKDTLGKFGKKAADTTMKAEELAGSVWQHLKTGPSLAEAAVGRIAQSTKVFAEGGYEKIFRETFETFPEEKLLKTFACYLSTTARPVMGVLYLSTTKIAFCSDEPLSAGAGGQTQWSYYKVVLPLQQLSEVIPSINPTNPSDKCIHLKMVDNHEFWFIGFLRFDKAVKSLQGALHPHLEHHVLY